MASKVATRREFVAHGLAISAAGLAAWLPSPATAADAVAANKEGPWQIGIYTRPFAQVQYRAAFDAIAEAGFHCVGLMTIKSKNNLVVSMDSTEDEARQVGRDAAQRGLKIVSVYGGGFPLEKNSLEPGIKGLKRLIDNVVACACSELLLGGIGGEDQQAAYYQTVRECCDYAAQKGVSITLKPHGPLNATGPTCRKCCEMVGKKNFGVWYDPGNICYYSDAKLDPVEDAASVDGLVRGTSIKDYRHPKCVDVTPGTGQVDFPAVMARLKKGGFTAGPVVIECLNPSDLRSTIAEARKARQFVEQLLRG